MGEDGRPCSAEVKQPCCTETRLRLREGERPGEGSSVRLHSGEDEIILFHRLKREHMGAIVDIQLGRLAKLLVDRKIKVDLDKAAHDWLAEKGCDPAYGARPLKRVIQKSLQDPLAEEILAGNVADGDTVNVGAGKDGLTLKAAKSKAKAA